MRLKQNHGGSEKKYFAEEYIRTQNLEKTRKAEEKAKRKKEKAEAKELRKKKKSRSPVVKAKIEKSRAKSNDDGNSEDSDDDDAPLSQMKANKKRRLASPTLNEPARHTPKASSSRSDSNMPATASASTGQERQKLPPPRIDTASLNKGKARRIESSSPTSMFSKDSSPDVALLSKTSNQPSASTSSAPKIFKSNRPKARTSQMPSISSGSALETKKRIAQGIIMSDPNQKPKPPNLANLSFKKKPLPDDQEIRTSLRSPSPTLNDNFNELFGSSPPPETPRDEPQAPRFTHNGLLSAPPPLPPPRPVNPNMEAAERLLQEMMPVELSAPFDNNPSTSSGSHVAPISTAPLKPAALPRIPKKWKWNGELFINVANDKAEKLCDVTIVDVTEPPQLGIRFNVLFIDLGLIRLSKLHDVSDLEMVLAACDNVAQMGKLISQDPEKDGHALTSLANYMRKRRLVTFATMYLENASMGLMLFIPSEWTDLCERFKVPPDLRTPGSLVSILFPWAILPAAYAKIEWRKNGDAPVPFPPHPSSGVATVEPGLLARSLRKEPLYHRALRILKFPQEVHDFISRLGRPYCVWSTGDGTASDPGIETKMLHVVLGHCHAQDIGYNIDKGHAGLIFVHVGAVRSLHKLPRFAERRSKHPDVCFFTYGTSDGVPPERWGVHEIYPFGGIVTFTPNALIEDPLGTQDLIKRIAEHAAWECYVMPTVVGMVAKTGYNGADPIGLFDEGQFVHDYLLRYIEDGHVSLLRAPPLTRNVALPVNDPIRRWISWQLRLSGLDARDLLADCVKKFVEHYSNYTGHSLSDAFESEITKDMLHMQGQPTLMRNYRRFVVITGAGDDHILPDKEGLEWLPLSKFDFKDALAHVDEST
ncbi:hypothetical protein PLICRDRAFT_35872 [Plicaturopsis crispa FD-325 SS-3]|nr:hypothetical protein PLICRDRAFT_35872 [Plicaturopsis crispa FD-325 SS-3]